MPDAKTVGDWITAIIPDQAKGLVDYVIAATGGNNNRLPIPETVTADNGLQVVSNPKHTPGMPGNRSNAGTNPAIRWTCLTPQFQEGKTRVMLSTPAATSIGSTRTEMAFITGPVLLEIHPRRSTFRRFRSTSGDRSVLRGNKCYLAILTHSPFGSTQLNLGQLIDLRMDALAASSQES